MAASISHQEKTAVATRAMAVTPDLRLVRLGRILDSRLPHSPIGIAANLTGR